MHADEVKSGWIIKTVPLLQNWNIEIDKCPQHGCCHVKATWLRLKNQNKTPSCEHGISLDFHLLKLKGFLKCNMHFAVATCANVQPTFYVINVAVVVYFGSWWRILLLPRREMTCHISSSRLIFISGFREMQIFIHFKEGAQQ